MSYILDALRRADSERERERSAVPGLHTQAVPVGGADAETEAPANPWKWPITAAFVALLGLVAWLWLGRAEAPESVASRSLPSPVAPLATPPAPAAPAAPPVAVPTAVPATASTAAASPPPAVSTTTAPVRDPAAPAARKPPAPSTNAKASPALVAPKPAVKASEPEVPISTLNELPDAVRRELPAITVGGSIYSKSAANRMLVINGQVFHEGDELVAGLVLEQIRQKSAVLKFKTYRYEITY